MEYRCVLEVCKFAEPRELVGALALVSRRWKQACDSDELWYVLIETRGYRPPQVLMSPKTWFRYLNNQFSSLPCIRKDHFTLFHCRKSEWSAPIRLLSVIQADQVTASVVLPEGSLLCCGGGNWKTDSTWDTAYRVMGDGKVEQLKPMQQAREAHGIVCCKDWVYVFGGDCDPGPRIIRTGEKLHLGDISTLKDRDWSILRNMCHHHSYFTPALYQELIYLCGGYCARTEVFDPRNDSFRGIGLKLVNPEHAWSVVYEEKLVVVAGYRLHIYNRQHGRGRLQIKPNFLLDEYSGVPPILFNHTVYRLLMNGDVIQTDLSTQADSRLQHPRIRRR